MAFSLQTLYQCAERDRIRAWLARRLARAGLEDQHNRRVLYIPHHVSKCLLISYSIIAIHGLGAHWPTTWEKSEHYPPRRSDRKVNWLCDKDMLPSKIPEARILRYDWDGNYCQDASTDTNLGQAANLLESIVYLQQKVTIFLSDS